MIPKINNMRTVRLMTCNDSFQARLIKGALENEGISAVLHNENISNVLRGHINNISGVDIFVYEDDYESAMAILEENQMIPERLIYCPYCGSKNMKFVLKKKHRIRAIFSTILAMLAAATPGTEHWEYVCNDCGKSFDKPVGKIPADKETNI